MGAKTQTQPNLKDLGVDGKLADRALRALLKHHESSADKEQLLGNDLDVQVQFSLARIPGNSSPKPIRIELPHALVKTSSGGDDDAMDEDNLQDVEACLIVKEESKPWVQEMIARFPNELGCIKKVLGLQSLRIKHKSFTQRRELLARFDVFFADDRILPMLTKSLGGKFFEKKKQPIPVSLTRKEALPFAIQKSLKSTFMYLSAGTCVTVKAGNTAMSSEKLLANIKSITTMVPTKVPRKWSNIRAISIKTSSSVALPIYNKTPEELELIMELVKKEGGKQIEEKKEDSEKGKKKRKVAASTPLAKALKKSKAVEVEAEAEVVEEKPKKSSKKKRKESIDATEVEKKVVAKTPKSSKKKTKEPIETKEEVAVKEVTKTPKSSKKKKKEAVESNDQEEEVVKKEAKTPKSSKKRKSKAEDSTAASAKKTPKKNSDDASTKDSNFISSKKFSGAKKGFVFKKSNLGIGYYKDALPMVDATWLATLSKKAGRSGGRKSMGNTVKRKKGGRRSY